MIIDATNSYNDSNSNVIGIRKFATRSTHKVD
jgi:hypothetical protein